VGIRLFERAGQEQTADAPFRGSHENVRCRHEVGVKHREDEVESLGP
jgi:hypothetical protein